MRRKEKGGDSEEGEEETPRQRRGKGAVKTPAKTPSRKKKVAESSEEEEEEEMEEVSEYERAEEAQVCYILLNSWYFDCFSLFLKSLDADCVQVDSEDDDFVQPAAPVVRRGGRRR